MGLVSSKQDDDVTLGEMKSLRCLVALALSSASSLIFGQTWFQDAPELQEVLVGAEVVWHHVMTVVVGAVR